MELTCLFGWEVWWIIVMNFFKCEAKRKICVFGNGKLFCLFVLAHVFLLSLVSSFTEL